MSAGQWPSISSRGWLVPTMLCGALWAGACTNDATPDPTAKDEPPAPSSNPESMHPESEAVPPETIGQAPAESSAVTRLKVTPVRGFSKESWVHCGYLHIVGAVEVEVDEVVRGNFTGDRAVLLISCPAEQKLDLGSPWEVSVHATAQDWPDPVGIEELPQQLERLQVESLHADLLRKPIAGDDKDPH